MLVRIEIAGPGAKARRLVFDDGGAPRETSAAAVKRLGIEEGTEVAREAVVAALSETEYGLAKERALRLLGYREHSAEELLRKLRDTGYPEAVAQAVVARFTEIELVDDARFAAAWNRSRAAAGYGPRRIRRELEMRGVSPETIRNALSDGEDSEDELARALSALGGRTAADRQGRDRLVRRLVSRGFALSVALRAVRASDIDED